MSRRKDESAGTCKAQPIESSNRYVKGHICPVAVRSKGIGCSGIEQDYVLGRPDHSVVRGDGDRVDGKCFPVVLFLRIEDEDEVALPIQGGGWSARECDRSAGASTVSFDQKIAAERTRDRVVRRVIAVDHCWQPVGALNQKLSIGTVDQNSGSQ